MKLLPSLIMHVRKMPFAARILPLLAPEETVPKARWEREYASGRWSRLANLDELAHYSVIAGYYGFVKAGGRVLDVGCGEGLLQTQLARHGYRCYLGIDFAAGAIQRVVERRDATTDFQVADAETFSTSLEFDTIIFNETLYYLRDPVTIVQRYQAFLAGDGIMIVSMFIERNRIAIWSAIEAVLETVDETNVFNGAGLGWTIKLLTPRRAGDGAASPVATTPKGP